MGFFTETVLNRRETSFKKWYRDSTDEFRGWGRTRTAGTSPSTRGPIEKVRKRAAVREPERVVDDRPQVLNGSWRKTFSKRCDIKASWKWRFQRWRHFLRSHFNDAVEHRGKISFDRDSNPGQLSVKHDHNLCANGGSHWFVDLFRTPELSRLAQWMSAHWEQSLNLR